MKKQYALTFLAVLCMLAVSFGAAASVTPPAGGGCALALRVENVIARKAAASALPDRITFTVQATDCPWLKGAQRHESSSIMADDATLGAIVPGALLSGTAAQGSTNGPNGAVSWTQFRAGGLSFTF